MVLVFNLLEPFGITIRSFIPEYHLILSTFGLISSMTMALWVYFIQPMAVKYWPKIDNINAVLWFLIVVLVLSLANWLYSIVLHDFLNGWHNIYVVDRRFMVVMPKFLVLFGLWALIALVNLFFINQSKSDKTHRPQELEETLTLHSENQADKFKVSALQLVCFKTCDNYLEVFYLDEANALKNRMIRSSMKKIEEQLNVSQFYRCHQSYLVNLAYVKGLKKIRNNHFLEVAYMDFDVSISRKNLKSIKTFLIG